jgi:hypothetical protein
MKNNPKIEELLDALQQILTFIQGSKEPIKITPELLANMKNLEKTTHDFQEATQKLFNLVETNFPGLNKQTLASPEIRSSDKQLIQRAHDIQKEAYILKFALLKARRKGTSKKHSLASQNPNKQQIRERRKLFKTIGGDKNWLPL